MNYRIILHRDPSEFASASNPGRSLYYAALPHCDLGPSDYLHSNYVGVELVRKPSAQPLPPENLNPAIDCRPRYWYRAPHSVSPKACVSLITACSIAARDTEAFLTQFRQASRYMSEQAAHLGYCLYQSTDPDSTFSFVNIANWRSVDSFIRVFQSDTFKRLITGGFQPRSQIVVTQAPTRRRV